MRLKAVYVRSYRAFNYDYLRKSHPGAKPDPWDLMEDGTFYPYVTMDIDSTLTCVVGANESGKSQLLDAIECALGMRLPTPADFCRYSSYFTVSEEMRLPEFGLHFESLTDEESSKIIGILDREEAGRIDSFRVFRTHPNEVILFLEGKAYPVGNAGAISELDRLLPDVLRIEPERALPDSVTIKFLASANANSASSRIPRRPERLALFDTVAEKAQSLFDQLGDPPTFGETTRSIIEATHPRSVFSEREEADHAHQQELARDLLITVGGIDPGAFDQLHSALRGGDEGLVNGIKARMNAQLEHSLNLAKWWTQDNQFRLAVDVRDFDIVLTIRDKTGSEYSFAERSGGLKYFLSYLVQALTHTRERSRSEILLMDEPDAYLSNQGQQDLLRVLHEFTEPVDDVPGGQVVFVTHSPFLIDKNRGDRIRVLDKGAGSEGVRVVRDVGKNHFEPLRTALGSFVGETAFIGNCNLMVEGMADQVYLAGLSDLLSRNEDIPATDFLDLNRVTLVPAGSASHVPYLVYLARGRDADKPAIIVLLDGDQAGDEAIKQLERGGPQHKQLIQPKHVVQIKADQIEGLRSDRLGGPLEIEDLVPIAVAVEAAAGFLADMGVERPTGLSSSDIVAQGLSGGTGVFKAIQDTVAKSSGAFHMGKLPFARHVVDVCRNHDTAPVIEMRARFAVVFRHLTSMQRVAERERERETISARVDRETSRFIRDVLHTATKADVSILLERIASVIDPSIDGDRLVIEIRRLREELTLDLNPNERIADHDALQSRIETLKYEELLAAQPKDDQRSSESTPDTPRRSNDSDTDGATASQVATQAGGGRAEPEVGSNQLQASEPP